MKMSAEKNSGVNEFTAAGRRSGSIPINSGCKKTGPDKRETAAVTVTFFSLWLQTRRDYI